jgi:formiminotetrahydrofolate cyclodeaminase
MSGKSEGLLQFEGEMAELEKRIERAEFNDSLAPSREYNRILEATLPKMTEGERASIRRTQLHAHQIGAEILAEHGHPVPGSDPKKPN